MLKFETFKLNKEFRRLYGQGRCFVYPALVIYIRKNRAGHCRIGITVGKKIGGAVKRNRAKRVIMAAFKDCLPLLQDSYDIVFVARVKTALCKSTEVKSAMTKAFTGLLTTEKK